MFKRRHFVISGKLWSHFEFDGNNKSHKSWDGAAKIGRSSWCYKETVGQTFCHFLYLDIKREAKPRFTSLYKKNASTNCGTICAQGTRLKDYAKLHSISITAVWICSRRVRLLNWAACRKHWASNVKTDPELTWILYQTRMKQHSSPKSPVHVMGSCKRERWKAWYMSRNIQYKV